MNGLISLAIPQVTPVALPLENQRAGEFFQSCLRISHLIAGNVSILSELAIGDDTDRKICTDSCWNSLLQ